MTPLLLMDRKSEPRMETVIECTTIEPGKGMKKYQTIARVSLEIIGADGRFEGFAKIVTVDWSEDNFREAAEFGLAECLKHYDKTIQEACDEDDEIMAQMDADEAVQEAEQSA